MNRRCHVRDLFRLSARTITDEGYLTAPGIIARAGNVQQYRAAELGLDGVPGDKVISLFRPPEEVFAPESVASFDGKPLTLNHPKEGVKAKNWRDHAVGDVRGVAPSGTDMTATVIIRDADAVKAVLDGKDQLSNGYSFELDLTPGKAADGTAYDGVQRKIIGNHVAIVDVARGGPTLRIADNQQGDRTMAMKRIVVDGISIELEDTQAGIVEKVVGDAIKAATIARDAAKAADTRATTTEKALADAAALNVKQAADHAAAVKELESKILTDAQIEALAAERAKVVGDAALLVKDFKSEGKTLPQIKAEVITHVIASDEALKPLALAVLGGVDVAKPESATLVGIAFKAVAAARGTKAADGDTTVVDTGLGRDLAGTRPGPVVKKLSGQALALARMRNGGKPLPEETAGR